MEKYTVLEVQFSTRFKAVKFSNGRFGVIDNSIEGMQVIAAGMDRAQAYRRVLGARETATAREIHRANLNGRTICGQEGKISTSGACVTCEDCKRIEKEGR